MDTEFPNENRSPKLRKKDPNASRPDKSAAAPPSFAKALYHGRILSDTLFPYPTSKPDEVEFVKMTLEAIEKLSREIDVFRIEEEKRIPPEWLEKIKEMGLFGLVIPEEYGGFGVSNTAYVQILSAIGLIDTSITVTLGAHQSIGLKALLLFGTPEQKQTYLPKLATGEWIAAFGLTEPGAGSDARSLKTNAELSPDGKHYTLNGSKIWITNGGIAHFYTIFARTVHTDDSGKTKEKITAFIVTRDMKGFSHGAEEKKMGLLGSSTTSLHFDNVKVPIENVLGEPGKGFKVAMEVLNNGRLGLAGACALSSKKAIHMAMEHALQRKQFGLPIAQFGLIQSKFANMAMEQFAAESMVRVTAHLMDSKKYDYSLETAACKVFCTEMEWKIVNECLQIAGGAGYMKELGIEKILRDSRIFMIWEGANEILRLFVGLSGLQGPGEQLKEVSDALKKPLADFLHSLGVLSDFGVRWIQKRVTTPDHLVGAHPVFKKETRLFEKYTAILAMEAERILLKYGKDILYNEFPVRRIADITIDLYAMACTLSRCTKIIQENGVEKSAYEITLTHGFCRKARRRIVENFRRMDKNDDAIETSVANTLYEKGPDKIYGKFTT